MVGDEQWTPIGPSIRGVRATSRATSRAKGGAGGWCGIRPKGFHVPLDSESTIPIGSRLTSWRFLDSFQTFTIDIGIGGDGEPNLT